MLYSTPATRRAARRRRPATASLEFRLADTSRPAADRTVAAVRDHLRATTAFTAFDDLPEIRKPGSYPGKDVFEQLASIMNVFTLLALLSALVLIVEHDDDADRRAAARDRDDEGDRRHPPRRSARIYLRTALLLGAAGSVIGVGARPRWSRTSLVRFFASASSASRPASRCRCRSSSRASSSGSSAPPLAALPAIRRAVADAAREALEESGSAVGGQAALDRAAAAALVPAAHGADRPAQRQPPQAAQPRDGRADRARRRDAARAARADRQRRQDHARRLDTSALRHLDPARSAAAARRATPAG